MKHSCRHSAMLHSYLDGELPEDQGQFVETHVESCGVCANELRSLQKLKVLLQDDREIRVSPDYDAVFWKKVRAVEEKRLGNRLWRWVGNWNWRYALAPACALVVLFAGLTLMRENGSAPFAEMGMVDQMDLLSDYDIVDNLDLLEQVAAELGQGGL